MSKTANKADVLLYYVIWQRVATYCDDESLYGLSNVCKILREITHTDAVWSFRQDGKLQCGMPAAGEANWRKLSKDRQRNEMLAVKKFLSKNTFFGGGGSAATIPFHDRDEMYAAIAKTLGSEIVHAIQKDPSLFVPMRSMVEFWADAIWKLFSDVGNAIIASASEVLPWEATYRLRGGRGPAEMFAMPEYLQQQNPLMVGVLSTTDGGDYDGKSPPPPMVWRIARKIARCGQTNFIIRNEGYSSGTMRYRMPLRQVLFTAVLLAVIRFVSRRFLAGGDGFFGTFFSAALDVMDAFPGKKHITLMTEGSYEPGWFWTIANFINPFAYLPTAALHPKTYFPDVFTHRFMCASLLYIGGWNLFSLFDGRVGGRYRLFDRNVNTFGRSRNAVDGVAMLPRFFIPVMKMLGDFFTQTVTTLPNFIYTFHQAQLVSAFVALPLLVMQMKTSATTTSSISWTEAIKQLEVNDVCLYGFLIAKLYRYVRFLLRPQYFLALVSALPFTLMLGDWAYAGWGGQDVSFLGGMKHLLMCSSVNAALFVIRTMLK